MTRGTIVSVGLDPTIGAEMQKTRPCAVVSPDVMNAALKTVIIAPLTSSNKAIPTRVLVKATPTSGLKNDSYAALDQVKTIDKMRIVSQIGQVSAEEEKALADALCMMFAY
jgi:mRNA interferase MazF